MNLDIATFNGSVVTFNGIEKWDCIATFNGKIF
jgi:hypothetical protein